jgi:ABC-type branched-subunit amino acid transport system ATPase component
MNKITYISQFPERQIVFSNLKQYKDLAIRSNNNLAKKNINQFIGLPDLTPVTQLNYFYQKLLLLCSLFSIRTELVILDEPDWGLSNYEISIFFNVLKEIYNENKYTLLIISHDIRIPKMLNSNILWLNNGCLNFNGKYDKFVELEFINKLFDIDESVKIKNETIGSSYKGG